MEAHPDVSAEALHGACHCGRVTVTVPAASAGVVVCHCADCQRLHDDASVREAGDGAEPFTNAFALLAAEQRDVVWSGEEHIRWYSSSAANERSFCACCGSRLAKRPREGTRVLVSAGLFPGARDRAVIKNLWTEQRPAWVEAPRGGPVTPEEFVALALAAPIGTSSAQYGYALRVASGNPKPPGVIALTWITARDAAERDRVRAHAQKNVEDFRREPGFLAIVTGFLGLRGFTVTAWEDEASLRRGLGGHHATAMKELLGEDFVASVWTSVWSPTRLNRLWVRCAACGALAGESLSTAAPGEPVAEASGDARRCDACAAELPPRPLFW